MITQRAIDTVVIGGGAAGLAASEVIAKAGFCVALIDREEHPGGILLQCIHNGFGLHHFGKELTGPEYAETCAENIASLPIDIHLQTTAVTIVRESSSIRVVTCSAHRGVTVFNAKTVVLAMGSRERNRGNIGIPGMRPAGIYTAGLAQRLLNIEGYIPGKRAVIVGSGDIGLIMARRLTWTGSTVATVVEILPYPSGLTRNIVQCLQDFSIPLQLSHAVTRIFGKERVEAVEIAPIEGGVPVVNRARRIECDTVLLSVGLIPENELSRKAGVAINPDTGGPLVDHRLQTGVPGIFACGNVLHVHDLVDYVTDEAQRCGAHVIDFLQGTAPEASGSPVVAGANLKYVVPNQCSAGVPQHFYMRPLVVRENAELAVTRDGQTVFTRKLKHTRPAEMISVNLPAEATATSTPELPLTFSVR